MKKLFKRVSILFAALMALSVSTVRTVEAADATITFDNVSKRTTFNTSTQVWTENAITVTNNKASSTSNVANYVKPARFYKSSELIVSAPDVITQIVFDANSSSYATALKNSLPSGTTSTVASDKVTVTLDGSSSTYTISCLSGGQVRMDAITVTYGKAELTDAEKVAKGLSNFSNQISTFYADSTEFTLPSSDDNNVVFTYEITTGDETLFAVDEDGVLSIEPTVSFNEATLKVTATLNDNTSFKEIKIASLLKDSTLTLSEASKVATFVGDTYTESKYFIVVDILSVYNTNYGNMYVKDSTVDSFTVYGTYSADGKTSYANLEIQPIAGDTVTIYGVLGTYNSTPQMKNGWITEHIKKKTNEELIAMEETSFSLSFDYALTYKEEEVDGTGVETTASLSFADKAQRTSYSTSQQVWEQNGIKLTGKKAESSTAVGDYANPARFYASSSVSVEVAEGCTISEIVFTTTEGAAALVSSIGDEASASGNIVTCKPTNSSNVYEIAKLSAKVFVSSISVKYASVGGTVEVVDDQAYANVGLTFGAKVTSTLFEGYTKVSGGVMIDNAANYTNTTIAEAYANGEFAGITTVKESLNVTDDGFYSVGSTIEVIDGLVDENNKKYLSYEFVAAVYFTLENAEGTTTVVLEQKAYSVSTMVDYYLANSSGLGLNDETVKVVEAFDAFIG